MKPRLKVVEFPNRKKRAIQHILGSLRRRFKDGEVTEITVLWIHKDGSMYRDSSATNGTQLWQTEKAKHSILESS